MKRMQHHTNRFVAGLCASLMAVSLAHAQLKPGAKPGARLPPGLTAPQSGAAAETESPSAGRDSRSQRIIAVVNDEIITGWDLQARSELAARQLRQSSVPIPPEDVFRRQMLDRLIEERILLQQARDAGIAIPDTQVDAALGRIAEANKLDASRFKDAVERDGINWKQFREQIRSEMTMVALREREVDSKVVITDQEVDNAIANAPPSAADAGAEYLVAHILVRVPSGASQDEIARKYYRTQQVMEAVRRGRDFQQLAVSYSEAPDSVHGGGLGWRTAQRLPGLFTEVVPRMQVGQTSDILRSANGFHVIKLLDKRGSTTPAVIRRTHARHILIKTTEGTSVAEATRTLTALRERLVNGENFEALAKVHSQDFSGVRGGDLGWINPGETVPEFEKAMNALQPGEISAPVQSQFGVHLIQVIERKDEDLSDQRGRIEARQALRERKVEEAFQDWVRQLRDRAYVENRLDDE